MGLFDALTAQTPQGEQLRGGLLGMAAGLLQGSTGHYGQFGPALGQGFAGFAGGMQNAQENQMRQQLFGMKQQQAQIGQQQQAHAQQWWAQNGGNLTPQAIQSGISTGNPYLMDMIKQATSVMPKPRDRRTQFDPQTGMLIDLDAGSASPVLGPTGAIGGRPDMIFDSVRGVMVDKRTGQSQIVMGPDGRPLPAQNNLEKPMTEAQSKDLLFGSRAREATKIIDDFMATKPSWLQQTGTAAVGYDAPAFLGPLGSIIETGLNTAATPAAQKFNQAQRDFINAVLRKESGAVISAEEFANAEKQYFPQPGDSPEVIAQKKANRDLAIDGILMGAPAGQRDSLRPRGGARPSLSELLD